MKMINQISIVLISISFLLFVSCVCELFGSHELGNNIVLLEGDRPEDRIIVYCTGRSGGCCSGGVSIIPTYENHIKQDMYNEYVEGAKSNNKWIIARSYRILEKSHKFWIINKNFNIDSLDCNKIDCDSVIQSHVIGPLDSLIFLEKVKELDVNLYF